MIPIDAKNPLDARPLLETGAPVFLLVNEATHAYRPTKDESPRAAIDDLLPPPFTAVEVHGLELVVHRLTPDEHAPPMRATRDELLRRFDEGECEWSADELSADVFEVMRRMRGLRRGAYPKACDALTKALRTDKR